MAKVPLYDQNKMVIGEVELSDEVFCSPVKDYLIYDAVKMYLANKRQGTASTKTRGEVSGGGKKPWKQKGTGRARAGSNRSPLWRKGAILFGPKPRDYSYKLPKKALKSAMKSALSLKLSESKLFVVDAINMPEIKTKKFNEIVKKFELNKVLFVLPERDRNIELSSRNIPNVKVLKSDYLNVYEIMKYDGLVVLKDAVKNIEGALSL
ncbi:MAG: 50S ribosomal protein L4 [Proteobacteria bacterium]|nr:50S ribosomal protein L4 [Pseudomonadota bacterium]